MEVADLLRKRRLAQLAIGEAVETALKDFYNQTGFLIQSVTVDLKYQIPFGQSAPIHTNVSVRCGLDLESQTQKWDVERKEFGETERTLLQMYGEKPKRVGKYFNPISEKFEEGKTE